MQLFNLANDQSEQKNLLAENPARVESLLRLLEEQVNNGRCTPGETVPNDREIKFRPN
jgi:arylsulfatase A